jgi:argininosuccinate lyase
MFRVATNNEDLFTTNTIIAPIPVQETKPEIMDGLNVINEPTMQEIQECLAKYKKYKEVMAIANRKYRQTHKEVVNKIAKAYYDRNKDNEDWRKKQCEKSKRAYLKKKDKDFKENTLITIEL